MTWTVDDSCLFTQSTSTQNHTWKDQKKDNQKRLAKEELDSRDKHHKIKPGIFHAQWQKYCVNLFSRCKWHADGKGFYERKMGMMLILVCRWNNILRWYLCYPSVKPNKNVWNSCHIREPDTFTWDTTKVTVEYCCRIPSHKSSTCEEMYMSDHILIREMYQIAPWYCPTRIKCDNHQKPL